MKKILLIAFHFPPVKGSTGLHRALSLTKYLSPMGWKPAVLTSHPRAYDNTSDELLSVIPEDVSVVRAFSLNSYIHLSIKGKYFKWTALPDRWIAWLFGGVLSGVKLIRRFKPDVIWTTYPIATAHLIGLVLQKLFKIPWVADFRDPMSEDGYPARKLYPWVERHTVKNAAKVVFTTQGTLKIYEKRYPDMPASKWVLVENGVDEEFFGQVESNYKADNLPQGRKLRFLHSGMIYLKARNPSSLFDAISNLKKAGKIDSSEVEFVFRASSNDEALSEMVRKRNIDDLVFFEPAISYSEAIEEMLSSDGLLVLQSDSCNLQVPAKVYEYFRSGKPILGLTDLSGDTGVLLNSEEGTTVVPLDSVEKISECLPTFIEYCRENRNKDVRDKSDRYSRKNRVEKFVNVFESL